MQKIVKYKTADNELRYEFQLYLGIDPQTGRKKRTRRRGFKTKKSAELALSRLKLELANKGTLKRDNNILFSKVYNEWFEQYVNTVRESTYTKTQGMFNKHILPAFGDKRIRTITIDQVQRAVNKWFKATSKNYKRWYNYTVAVFEFAIKRGYMTDKNPAKFITMPHKEDVSGDAPENFWNKQELAIFFSHIDRASQPETYTLFRLLAWGGLRRGEILALTWNDLNLKGGTLRINKTLTQGEKGKQIVQAPKTRKSRRTIVLDPKTLELLKRWRAIQKRNYMALGFNTMHKDQLIFASRTNTHKSLNTPAKWLNKILKTCDFKPITVHGFRHSHASALFAAGATIKEVQERLGHQDVTTTLNIYTHVTKDQNKRAVEKLVNYLNF
jgi:integrase